MDPLLLIIQLLLGGLGILGVATAEPSLALEHGLRFLATFLITVVMSRIKPMTIVRYSPHAYLMALGLLALVLVIGVSPDGSDSKRWLLIGGFSLQPSELMKVAVIAYLTAFFHNHLGDWQIWRPMLVIGIAAGLIVVEPNVSTSAFLFALAFAIMIAAGTSLGRLVAISTAAAVIALLVAGSYLSQFEYIGERIAGFQDLWGDQSEISSTSYQAYQARQTLVKAGLFGIGPGRPDRVPAAETDMVAVAVGQSLGLAGLVTVIALYVLLAGRGLRVASAQTGPGSLLAAGATTYICGQAALNLLVASGLFPVTGIPLPFMSYGLNSLVSVAIAMGFIQGAYRHARSTGALT
ncbi:MAG TPA: FtsW/RodA/SpoVE family cell cycle protein [Trueperaceae bacterium]